MEQIAILGFGCAGYHCLKTLRAYGSDAQVDVYTDTDLPPCNPMLTTYYVKGKIPYEALFPFGSMEDIQKELHFTWFPKTLVEKLDASTKTLTLPDGTQRRYDKILLATGTHAFSPPVGDLPAERVFTMRTVRDATRLRDALAQHRYRRVLVTGAMMVGIKLVELLVDRGIECVFSDLAPHVFPLAAFDEASERVEALLRRKGVDLRFGVKVEQAQLADDGMADIRFSDGSTTRADIAIMCIGIRPNLSMLDPTQFKMGKGVQVDAHMESSVPGIYAAGDCCDALDLQVRAPRQIGLWANAGYQGDTAGASMCGASLPYGGDIAHNITHFLGIDFISFGDKTLPGEKTVFLDEDDKYIIATVRDGQIQCINILNLFENCGTIKNYMMRRLNDPNTPPSPQLDGLMLKNGVPQTLIDVLGGNRHDGN